MDTNDNALMLAARDGDLECFAELFERHHIRLWEFFYRMTGSRSDSEDLVQEVFLRMLKYRATFHADSQFRAWMYRIARNARMDRLSKGRAETPLGPESDAIPGSGAAPHTIVERAEHFSMLHRALMKLPEDKREILVLARYQEMKYEEIGELLNVEVNTVKVRVHRAMNELREIFMKLSNRKPLCDVKTSEPILRTT
ncbi:MAG TPA: RNA polymerase sigma factor [Terriglobia bacterium]|nr:RNA polymerase sigma factor [Terriglobia bacterium]